MASRIFYQTAGSLEREPISLFCKFTLGASGAVASTNRAKGITSVTKESTRGQYTLALADPYNELLGFAVAIENAAGIPTGTPSGGQTGVIQAGVLPTSTTVTADVQAKTLRFQLSGPTSDADATPAAVDAASGDILRVTLLFANTAA